MSLPSPARTSITTTARAVLLVTLVMALGCKSSGEVASDAGGAAAAAGECSAMAEALCEEAGERSQLCQSMSSISPALTERVCKLAREDLELIIARAAKMRAPCAELASKACADLGKDTKTCLMVSERTAEFPVERCQQMLDQYAAVLADLRRLEAMNQPLSPELAAKLAAGKVGSHGPPDAKVVVVEYIDFECPYCSQAADVVEELKERFGKVVRFVVRHFPLSFHPNAKPAAEASLAALAQDAFWPYYKRLFANQDKLDRASLERYASELGLDVERFKRELDEGTYRAAVEADMALAEEVGVGGTPSVFVGTERIEGFSEAVLSKVIETQLEKAGVAVP